ncbi:MAG: UDP-N-acetylmuramoyl-tripeptide--D-alanyl-D-alanine ligase [Legionella sp.]|nr:MAG: UDP-N-acetylmuramoyl-tripeptide--D-alanyl-D-alanine ligase [Legionella sp.]
MNLSDIARILNVPCANDQVLSGLSIDSRHIQPGQVFVAILGERFDGHDYVVDAVRSGAVAVICERALPDVSAVQWVVPSTLNALAAIARWHRQQFNCPVIAVTGSNGKTTVKEMIAHILPQPSFATRGNLNNHIGAPLSALQLRSEHHYAVFELGASGPGDIAHTVAIVQPSVSLVNNIAPAHIEGFGSIDGVARAKGEIYQGLSPTGTVVINDDDAYAHFWDDLLTPERIVVRFSRAHAATVYARDVILSKIGHPEFKLIMPLGEAVVRLKVPGHHNVSNALAAASCAYAVGISLPAIVAGLESFTGVSGRMTFRQGKHEATIIDDTYNANLRSTLTAVDVLSKCSGVRILVLGDMAELGVWGERHHEEIGLAAREQGIDWVLTCGTLSAKSALAFGSGGQHYDNQDELAKDLLRRLNEQTTVLVKGSRSAAMEHIVQQLI